MQFNRTNSYRVILAVEVASQSPVVGDYILHGNTSGEEIRAEENG